MLHKAWTEPRHFFFWVALFSPFTFVMVILISGAADKIPPVCPWLALAAALGFLLGLPAFLLAWIPPLRPWFTRLLQHKLLVLAGLITLVGLFYAVENWRGRRAWNNFRHDWESRGVKFDIASVIPPPLPNDKNFFETPEWDFLQFTSSSNGVAWKHPAEIRDTVKLLTAYGPHGAEAPHPGDLFIGKRISLADWQTFYRSSNNVFAAGSGRFTNYFPMAAQPQTPAQDVLLALSNWNETLEALRNTARQRPAGRFWINYESGIGSLFPHLSHLKGCAQFLRIRSAALLADGQTAAARDDVVLAFQLNDKIQSEPILISQLVRIAVLNINLLTVWDGLAEHRWTEPDLAALERELSRLNFLRDFHLAMDGERCCFALWAVDFIQRTGDMYSISGTEENGNDSINQFERGVGGNLLRLAPSGWFDQNRLSLSRRHTDLIRSMVDTERQLVPPQKSREIKAQINSIRITPYDLLSPMLLPALDSAAKRFANAQTYANLARVAVACERYRLAAGNYPEQLDLLAPKWLPNVPHDIINGQPLKYHRTDDGQFILYSVGWNETDDGGNVAKRVGKDGKEAAMDQNAGDWVWQYPPRN